jgi:spore coat polysaccharide biosynthesis protein SpsF
LQRIDDDVAVIVATSVLKQDDRVAEIAERRGVECFRGSEGDVLGRYYQAAKEYQADCIIRATGDNPFVDPSEGRKVLLEINTGKWDYVSCFDMVGDGKLPTGVGLEAFTFAALERSWKEGKLPHHREHVDEYILENLDIFPTKLLQCQPQNSCPELSLTVDTAEELAFVREMVRQIDRPACEIKTCEMIQWYRKQLIKS